MIVVDANVIAYLVIPGDRTPEAEATLLLDPEWTAPELWRSELRNVLATLVRHGRVTLDAAVVAFRDAESRVATAADEPATEVVLHLASTSGATAYDCEYVALADLLDLPLVTADRKLAERFPARAVKLADFATAAP